MNQQLPEPIRMVDLLIVRPALAYALLKGRPLKPAARKVLGAVAMFVAIMAILDALGGPSLEGRQPGSQ